MVVLAALAPMFWVWAFVPFDTDALHYVLILVLFPSAVSMGFWRIAFLFIDGEPRPGRALVHAIALGLVSPFLAIGFCGMFTGGYACCGLPIAATPLGFLYGAAFGVVVWAVTRFAPKDDR